MGLLDWVTGKIKCPQCGTSGARETGGQIICPNPSCAYFDARSGGSEDSRPTATSGSARGNFIPSRSIEIRYKNFQGEEKVFIADAVSAVRTNHHIVAVVAPKGLRISLSRDRIANLREVEDAFPQRVQPEQNWPTARERQILGYHKKHKSSSAMYEKIHSKYPQW
jgi:hypothetical protein